MTFDDRARAREILDLHEGRGPVPVLDDPGIERVLREHQADRRDRRLERSGSAVARGVPVPGRERASSACR